MRWALPSSKKPQKEEQQHTLMKYSMLDLTESRTDMRDRPLVGRRPMMEVSKKAPSGGPAMGAAIDGEVSTRNT